MKKVSFKGILTLDYNDEKQSIIQKFNSDFLIKNALVKINNIESKWKMK